MSPPRHDGGFSSQCVYSNYYLGGQLLPTQYLFLICFLTNTMPILLGVAIAQLKNLLFLTFLVTNCFPCETVLTNEFERKFSVDGSNKSFKMGQTWQACLLTFCLFQSPLFLEHKFNDDVE